MKDKKETYIAYSEEWKKEMLKLPKQAIINMFADYAKQLLSTLERKQIDAEERHENMKMIPDQETYDLAKNYDEMCQNEGTLNNAAYWHYLNGIQFATTQPKTESEGMYKALVEFINVLTQKKDEWSRLSNEEMVRVYMNIEHHPNQEQQRQGLSEDEKTKLRQMLLEIFHHKMGDFKIEHYVQLISNQFSQSTQEQDKRKGYYCSACGQVPVDAENGYDTCPDCVSKI